MARELDARALVYLDGELAVFDKPPGLLHLGAPGREGEPTLAGLAAGFLRGLGEGGRLVPLHRLDEETSGLAAFARSEEARRRFEPLFRRHEVERVYLGLVLGVPSPREGELRSRLAVGAGGIVRSDPAGRPARTRYAVLEPLGRISLVAFRLGTGLRNQIRVQMAEVGHPLLGDRKYGRRRPPFPVRRTMLHAHALALPARTGGLRLQRDPPPDFQRALERARAARA